MRMLGCLEVVEYSLKERFNKKYLHHVSYLHLQDVIGVCLSYCCLSGTTPGIISAFARCNWRVPTILPGTVYPVQRVYLSYANILLSIRYNVYTCHSPIYHYIIATVVYLIYRIIPVCRGYVIIELVSAKDE